MNWYVYILQCRDKSLYTGISSDLKRRLVEHSIDDKRGSKYVRARRPVKLAYKEKFPTRGAALKRESEIKSWSRRRKLELIAKGP